MPDEAQRDVPDDCAPTGTTTIAARLVTTWKRWEAECIRRSDKTWTLLPTDETTQPMEALCKEVAQQVGMTTTDLRVRLITLRHKGFDYDEVVDLVLNQTQPHNQTKETNVGHALS